MLSRVVFLSNVPLGKTNGHTPLEDKFESVLMCITRPDYYKFSSRRGIVNIVCPSNANSCYIHLVIWREETHRNYEGGSNLSENKSCCFATRGHLVYDLDDLEGASESKDVEMVGVEHPTYQ